MQETHSYAANDLKWELEWSYTTRANLSTKLADKICSISLTVDEAKELQIALNKFVGHSR